MLQIEGYGFVDHGKDVGVVLGKGEEGQQCPCGHRKTSFWNGNRKGRRGNIGMDFRFFARKKLPGPLTDIGGHVGSDKTGRNRVACGLDYKMDKGMDACG